MLSLYTLIADYAGGTYISQRRASTPARVVAAWARSFDFGVIPRVSQAALPAFRANIVREVPVEPAGIRGVWCVCAHLGRRFLILHIVSTLAHRSDAA